MRTHIKDSLHPSYRFEEAKDGVEGIKLRRKLREKFNIGKVLKPGEIAVTSMDDQFLQKAMAIVEQRMKDEKFTVEEFAGEIGMSRSQLQCKLIALTNQSPSDFIRYMRLHRAKELLEKNAGSVSEIAYLGRIQHRRIFF